MRRFAFYLSFSSSSSSSFLRISHNNIFAGKKTHGSCPPTIGKRIRDCRETKELSIEAFAMELGKSYEYVVAYENDRRNPKEDTLEEMAKILGTSSDYLKYGFIRRSYVSDDKMYEFEYRDLPSNETNAKENISKINECINTIKKNIKNTSVLIIYKYWKTLPNI